MVGDEAGLLAEAALAVGAVRSRRSWTSPEWMRVRHQVGLLAESLAAVEAGIGPLARVDVLVGRQVETGAEDLAAVQAHEGRLRGTWSRRCAARWLTWEKRRPHYSSAPARGPPDASSGQSSSRTRRTRRAAPCRCPGGAAGAPAGSVPAGSRARSPGSEAAGTPQGTPPPALLLRGSAPLRWGCRAGGSLHPAPPPRPRPRSAGGPCCVTAG